MRFAPVAVFLLVLLTLPSCSSPSQNSNVAGNGSPSVSRVVPKDNVDEFSMLVRLPVAPEEVVWDEKPEQKKLTAVILFSPENASKFAAEIAKNGKATPVNLTVETWYPNELIAQGELTGESTVTGQSYPADAFLNPPYTTGTIVRVDNTDYFILQISS